MSDKYEHTIAKNGVIHWKKNGKRITKRKVPLSIRRSLTQQIKSKDEGLRNKITELTLAAPSEQIEALEEPKSKKLMEDTIDNEKDENRCLFCGKYATNHRGIIMNGVIHNVGLCEDCYFYKTYGEVMEKYKQLKTKGEGK